MIQKIWDEFKSFALRGNMVDLALGVIIGASFNKVISSLVSDIISPILGLFIGGIDFSKWNIPLKLPGSGHAPIPWNIGNFVAVLIDFGITAIAIFSIIKLMSRLHLSALADEPSKIECPKCAMEIPRKASVCAYCHATVASK